MRTADADWLDCRPNKGMGGRPSMVCAAERTHAWMGACKQASTAYLACDCERHTCIEQSTNTVNLTAMPGCVMCSHTM